jgi:hypothetical protein
VTDNIEQLKQINRELMDENVRLTNTINLHLARIKELEEANAKIGKASVGLFEAGLQTYREKRALEKNTNDASK